ncbi:sacsin N-terminal ATP-binding-like domain-containing protein [Vibrio alginolyticus]
MSSQKAELQQFRKDKYQLNEVTGESMLQEDAKSDLHNSVNIISEQLYSKDVHFVFELIQNAEDNHYAKGVAPKLHFELLDQDPTGTDGANGCLAIFNNELGFNIKNIKAVSSIGKSTKAGSKDAGYIGEKGIGFKSVFSVSPSPHIFSNGYHFLFKDKDDIAGLGYIIPYWVDDVPALVQKKLQDYNTCILLPLRADKERDIQQKIKHELNNLDASILLFLNKLDELTVRVDGKLRRYSKQLDGEVTTLINQQGEAIESTDYLVVKKSIDVPSTLTEEKRDGVVRRDLCIAFRKDLKPDEKPNHKLYAYLPTELHTGLPFLVNADFLLPASRESVLVDKQWNHWMRDEVADFASESLSRLLVESKTVDYFSQIPHLDNCTEDFLRPIFKRILEALEQTSFIPSLTGGRNLPSDICFADKEVTDLLSRLNSNEDILPARVLSQSVRPYERLLRQFHELQLDAEEILSYLSAAQLELTALPEAWFVSMLHWLSRQDDEFHYKTDDNGLEILHQAPLFLTENGVFSSHNQALFLSSNTHIEYPVLSTPSHKTNHGLISTSFQKLLQEQPGTLAFVKEYFDIEVLSQSEYLAKVALPFCEEHWQEIEQGSLWNLNYFVVQHWFSLNDHTKRTLDKSLPLKNRAGSFELKEEKQLVTPEGDESSFVWQTLFNSEEQEHFLVLSNDYLELFDKFEKVNKGDFYSAVGVSATPLPKTFTVTKSSRYGRTQLPEGIFSDNYETYLRNKIDGLDSTGVIRADCYKLPAVCLTPDAFSSKALGKAFVQWLVALENKLLSPILITYFYRTSYAQRADGELYQWLKDSKWLPTQNGLKRPDETFIATQGSRELYGNAVNFLDDDFALSQPLAEKLGVASEVNSETVLKVLRSWSAHNDEANVDDVMKLYDRLADTGSNLESLFEKEALIYCPSGERNWCKSGKAIWKSQKEVLGELFHWLSDVYPDYKAQFWLNTVKVSQHPESRSFADAWLHLQTLPVIDRDKSRNVRNKLAAIYERLISYIKVTGINNLEPWFEEFVSQARCFTQNYRWESRLTTYISDDRRVAKLFEGRVEFFWRTRGKTHADFDLLYSALRLKGVSEEVYREVDLDTAELTSPPQPILTSHSRLLLAYYYKQYLSKSGSVVEDWYKKPEIFDLLTVNEYCVSEDISVTYELNDRVAYDSVEVLFDDEQAVLLYNVAGKDTEDLVDDLAEEISKLIVTKAFIEEQDHIRPLLNVTSRRRFDKRIDKKHWENVLTKKEVQIIKSLRRQTEGDEPSKTNDNETEVEDTVDNTNFSDNSSDDQTRTNTERDNSDFNEFSPEDPNEDSENNGEPNGGSRTSEGDGAFSNNGSSRFNSQRTDQRSRGSGSNTSEKSNREESSQGSTAGRKHSNGGKASSNEGGHNDNEVNGTSSRSPSYRMVSYVEKSEHQSKSDKDKKARAKKVGDKAEVIVVKWLQREGFDVEHLGGNNPGFDIRATDTKTGETYFVEVKGMLGSWSLMGFALSSTQMEKCRDYGDNYWLIVVENVVNDPKLYQLINPAGKIDAYCFDSNWKHIAEQVVVFNNSSGEGGQHSADYDDGEEMIGEDFFYCQKHKDLYFKCAEVGVGMPDVGFELQDPYHEVICELELAWPKHKKGVYTGEDKPWFQGWEFKTVDEVLEDLSWLDA